MTTELLIKNERSTDIKHTSTQNPNKIKEGVGELTNEEQRKTLSWTELLVVNQIRGNLGIRQG